MTNVNAFGAGAASLYTICTNRIETSMPDARLHESTGLTNELQRSAEFSIEVGDPMNLDTAMSHALPARMVARMHKLPLTTTPVEANAAKKRKTFVTNDKGTVIASGLQNEISRQKPVHPKTANASQNSSEKQIHGANLTCTLDTGSKVSFAWQQTSQRVENIWHTLRS